MLSTNAKKKETIHGLDAGFVIIVASGERMKINLLCHKGLGRRDITLRPKLLTGSKEFAMKNKLLHQGLTDTCAEDRSKHQFIRPTAKLSIVLSLDLGHLSPKLIDTYQDFYGYLSIFECILDG